MRHSSTSKTEADDAWALNMKLTRPWLLKINLQIREPYPRHNFSWWQSASLLSSSIAHWSHSLEIRVWPNTDCSMHRVKIARYRREAVWDKVSVKRVTFFSFIYASVLIICIPFSIGYSWWRMHIGQRIGAMRSHRVPSHHLLVPLSSGIRHH
jgi:hypothetical protein